MCLLNIKIGFNVFGLEMSPDVFPIFGLQGDYSEVVRTGFISAETHLQLFPLLIPRKAVVVEAKVSALVQLSTVLFGLRAMWVVLAGIMVVSSLDAVPADSVARNPAPDADFPTADAALVIT